MMNWVIWFTCLILPVVVYPSILCRNTTEFLSLDRFATKTNYFAAAKDASNRTTYDDFVNQCSAVKVWFITRHGTRYPVGDSYRALPTLDVLVKDIQYNFLRKRGCLTDEDIFEYKRWIPPYGPRDKGQLHSTGAEELYQIGLYWQRLFPSIFSSPYDKDRVKIEFTTRNRTGQSAYHFLKGMYGEDGVNNIKMPQPFTPNFKLRFYKACPRWLEDVYRKPRTYEEQQKFEETNHFVMMVHAVSERLGFTKPLTTEQISAMYDECRYEMAWWPKIQSIWCKPFTNHDLKVMEFHQDLKYYYEDSYGTPMNVEMACETVSDLLTQMDSAFIAGSPTEKQSCLYFSHDKALLHFYTTLGLFKPSKPLTHDQFETADHRKFRTSRLSPFASNLAFVLFKCGDSHKVVFFFQGEPTIFDSACTELFCDYHQIKTFLQPTKDSCNLSDTCLLHDEL